MVQVNNPRLSAKTFSTSKEEGSRGIHPKAAETPENTFESKTITQDPDSAMDGVIGHKKSQVKRALEDAVAAVRINSNGGVGGTIHTPNPRSSDAGTSTEVAAVRINSNGGVGGTIHTPNPRSSDAGTSTEVAAVRINSNGGVGGTIHTPNPRSS